MYIFMELISFIVGLLTIPILLYIIYNVPIAIAGLFSSTNREHPPIKEYPFVSVIVPAKNEERVIGRCLDALLNLDYPAELYEIIVVDGNSRDRTREICVNYMKRYPNKVKLIVESEAKGKPDALNKALKVVKGELIAVFDADSIPSKDVLLKVIPYIWSDNGYAAVQGRVSSFNMEKNILTRIVSVEETGWFRLILRGRDRLNLFVPFTGNSMFIKRDALVSLGGWRPRELAEDLELSLRLCEYGYKIKYLDEAVTLQEAPSKLSSFVTQRYRWYRGYISNLFRYGALLRGLNLRSLDMEFFLAGPILMGLSAISYILLMMTNYLLSPSQFLSIVTWILNIFILLILFNVLLFLRPKNITEILTIPSMIPYWIFESFIALKALLDTIFKRRVEWIKTEKEGGITIISSNENYKY